MSNKHNIKQILFYLKSNGIRLMTATLLVYRPVSLFSTSWATDTLTVSSSDYTLKLKHSYILPTSLKLYELFAPEDSIHVPKLEALNGKIYGKLTDRDSVKIVATYQYLDLNLPSQKIINPPPRVYIPQAESTMEIDKQVSVEPLKITAGYDFLKSGTIYRGVTLRSESGLSLQSGLNLELQGNLSDDITVIGTLTDQNIPIQPEGNTQTLDEIDKVFIKVNMPKEQITFGDYELSLSGGQYGSYNRKLQGILTESSRMNSHTSLAGAITKGQYYTNFFNGQEGNQGPYQLIGRSGETAIIVLAGTEKVWINGNLVNRGENGDYVIDYSTGEITFTPKQLITSDSRITVDFQYSNLIYQKNIWLAQSAVSAFDDKVNFYAGIINESDDKENPIELTLSHTDKEKLKQIGDNEATAFQSTIVEDTAGAYILVEVTSGAYILKDSVLSFVGVGNGTHTASFYNVGKSGKYRKIYTADMVYFEWVDKSDSGVSKRIKDEAIYLPAKPLRLPQKQRLYHIRSDWKPVEKLTIHSEFVRSELDRNTFSSIDDNDNFGNAINLDAELSLPMKAFGNFNIMGKVLSEGERFNPIDRHQVVEYRRKWDLPSDSTHGQELYEGAIRYRLRNSLLLSAEGGQLRQENRQSNRYKVGGTLHFRFLENGEFYHEDVRRKDDKFENRDWTRRKAYTQFNIFGFRPYADYYYEQLGGELIADKPFQFTTQTLGIMSSEKGKVRLKLEQSVRRDNERTLTDWEKQARAENVNFSGELLDWKTFSSQWNITHRMKKYFGENASPDIDFYLLYLMMMQNPKTFPVRWETNMKIEEERTVKKEWRYFYVGKGEGQFIYDSTFADYVPHPQGNYILRVLPSDIKEPVTSIQNGFRVQYSGNMLRGGMAKGLLSNISTLTDMRIQQQIRNGGNPFSLWTFFTDRIDEHWVLFNRVFQQDVSYRLKKIRGDLRFRFQQSNIISQLDVRGKENNHTDEFSLRYKGPIILRISINSEISSRRLVRESDINSLRDRDIQTVTFQNQLSKIWQQTDLVECEIAFRKDREKIEKVTSAMLTKVKVSYEKKMAGKGRWRVFSELDQVTVTPQKTPIPWEMGDGKGEGLTTGWGASMEYRIGQNISIHATYEGWNEPERGLYHIGSGEIRAMF